MTTINAREIDRILGASNIARSIEERLETVLLYEELLPAAARNQLEVARNLAARLDESMERLGERLEEKHRLRA